MGSSNFSWSLKHEIFPIVATQDLQDKSILGALDFEFAVSTVSKSEKWKPYQKWSSQERFMIGKYAAINDPAAAAAKKNELKSRAVNEITVRGFCAT